MEVEIKGAAVTGGEYWLTHSSGIGPNSADMVCLHPEGDTIRVQIAHGGEWWDYALTFDAFCKALMAGLRAHREEANANLPTLASLRGIMTRDGGEPDE